MPGPAEDAKGRKLHPAGPPPQPQPATTGGPPISGPRLGHGGPPPHPSQIAHYEALKAAGGPMYNPPYPGGHPGAIRHPGAPEHGHGPEAPNRGEFSGLVSYFSAQHDDLDQ